ncbi:MAG TPA: hypothetical protein VJK03_05280 [Candidatus Nanoarchaeia archaeon]|nr:hypothetical protein [Candidatus Nanoarchaeia archaeon]
MKINSLTISYILLIIAHFLHILEEVIGKASFIETIYNGTANFIIIMLLLLVIPVTLCYFINKRNKIAYILSYVYGIIMVLDGFSHIIVNYPGKYTGVALIILGGFLIFTLKRNKLR